ncbi:MAG TPA: response regulator [Dongiaceae bacterium]|jgi:CheY-like chemotaxis protein|nr:response regulator [Dongiaceae bacterium]
MQPNPSDNPKILLVDDDQDLLDVYKQILAQMPSKPEVFTAANGARAVAMLEEQSFSMLICDLRMPKMDGLQVLSIVRRKHPQLRTVVLTSVIDEEFRSRAYSIGVDLFWFKPGTDREIHLFLECLESLLGREDQIGFRGVQNKSLVDIIQLECISQNSLVLRITNGPLVGKIWIQDGEVIDATAEDLSGEVAFKGILTWKTGSFESLPAEPEHPRNIQKSYNALLLETVQAIDESQWQPQATDAAPAPANAGALPLMLLSRFEGAEFALIVDSTPAGPFEARGLENPEALANWARQTMQRFTPLADALRAGNLEQIECLGPQRSAGLAALGANILCMGWRHDLTVDEINDRTRKALIQWAS